VKNRILFVFIGFILLGFVGCSGETTTEEVSTETVTTEAITTEHSYDYTIDVVIGDHQYALGFDEGETYSVLELIEASDIELVYSTSEYGAMVTQIGDLIQDEFHWIGFTKNGEYAMSGIDSITYEDGDVFEFTSNFSNWEMTLEMTCTSLDSTEVVFELGDYQVVVPMEDISKFIICDQTYLVTGTPQMENGQMIMLSLSDFEPQSFEGHIIIKMGEQIIPLIYSNLDDSVLDLIASSDIELEFTTSEYGAMITQIGSFEQDDFHWIGFTKNDEFAMSGIDSIEYEDGDVFEFTENLVSWEIMLEAELMEKHEDYLVFENLNQSFIVYHAQLPEGILPEDLVIGFIYSMSGLVVDSTNDDLNLFNPNTLTLNVIDDFTDLYDLEVGDVVILEFTVTYTEDSYEFGTEIFASDINGLSSTDISEHMIVPSTTDYIFYTIPDGYDLQVGETYIGRFIYQVNEPSTIPQLTLYEYDINGEEIEGVMIQK
jgi:hypothetical protein